MSPLPRVLPILFARRPTQPFLQAPRADGRGGGSRAPRREEPPGPARAAGRPLGAGPAEGAGVLAANRSRAGTRPRGSRAVPGRLFLLRAAPAALSADRCPAPRHGCGAPAGEGPAPARTAQGREAPAGLGCPPACAGPGRSGGLCAPWPGCGAGRAPTPGAPPPAPPPRRALSAAPRGPGRDLAPAVQPGPGLSGSRGRRSALPARAASGRP